MYLKMKMGASFSHLDVIGKSSPSLTSPLTSRLESRELFVPVWSRAAGVWLRKATSTSRPRLGTCS